MKKAAKQLRTALSWRESIGTGSFSLSLSRSFPRTDAKFLCIHLLVFLFPFSSVSCGSESFSFLDSNTLISNPFCLFRVFIL